MTSNSSSFFQEGNSVPTPLVPPPVNTPTSTADSSSFFQDSNPTPDAIESLQTLYDNVETAADAIIVSANTAALQASNAASSASASAGSASGASTSATAAASSATSAASSASGASTSASNTAALLAAFQGVFLGTFASDSAAAAFASAHSITLSSGVMYDNTTEDKFRIYNGSAWGDYDATAAASQSAAALSATSAAASASAASTSETNAASSASSASSSATSAATSASSAASTLANALTKANNLSDVSNVPTARTNLGLGTFATANFATPPAIGGTTPNSGAFTTLSTSAAGSLASPSLALGAAGTDSGFYAPAAGQVGLGISNSLIWDWSITYLNYLTFDKNVALIGIMDAASGTGFRLDGSSAATATKSTIRPNRVDVYAGIGAYATGGVSIVVNKSSAGYEALRADTNGDVTVQNLNTAGIVTNTSAGVLGSSTLASLLTTWATSLPTSLPGSSGVVWNNGGVISIS